MEILEKKNKISKIKFSGWDLVENRSDKQKSQRTSRSIHKIILKNRGEKKSKT